MPMNAGRFRLGAEIFKTLHAPVAAAAGVRLPPKSDALTQFESAYIAALCRNGSNDFVAGNEGIIADAPVVRNQMKIAMANAAVRRSQFQLPAIPAYRGHNEMEEVLPRRHELLDLVLEP